MSNGYTCPICASGRGPEINEARRENPTVGTRALAAQFEVTRWAVRRHFEQCETGPDAPNPTVDAPIASLSMEGDTGTLSTGDLTEPIKDWGPILQMWDLDSSEFEIVEPVNVSVRDLANGSRLYAYRAKVKKMSKDVKDVEHRVDAWRRELFTSRSGQGLRDLEPPHEGVSYVIQIADPQLGKKGTMEAVDNWQRGVEGHVRRIKDMLSAGYQINQIVVANLGDETEGVANNYRNQPFTVELNLSSQLELDFDLRMWTIQQVAELGLPILVTSVISNHGEFTRNGAKDPITTKGDNSSTLVARLVQKAFHEIPGYDNLDWLIGEGDPAVVTTLNRVKTYLSHGYIEKGRGTRPEVRQVDAMKSQILGEPMVLGDVRVFLLAHYHHAWSIQDRGFTVFGAPALEAEKSSEYMKDQYGVWSKPGMAAMLIGEGCGPLGWSEYTII